MAHLYSLSGYGKMITNSSRTDAYVRALRAAVHPGSVVLDLGAGPGLFAMLACQMGASRVYAIELSDVIQVAREAAVANGFADRIEFFHAVSTRVTLPVKADVIISDLHGPLPFFEDHISTIQDARQRLLAENGILIPERDLLWAAIVEAPNDFEEETAAWGQQYGLDLSAARGLATNNWVKRHLKPDNLLVEPVHFHTVDYYTVEDANLHANISFSIARPGVAHGIAIWFDADLFQGNSFSNAPGREELIYGNGLFFFPKAVDVSEGDQVNVTLAAHLRSDYIWSWNTSIFAQGNKKRSLADFRQSTFLSGPLSLDELKKRATTHVPKLNPTGQIQSWILSRMDGSTPLEGIANELIKRFPNSFSDYKSTLTHVAQLSADYSD